FTEEGDAIEGWVEYRRARFDPATIEGMVGHYQMLLEGIAADPGRPLSQLPLLTGAERHQLLVEWNQTAAPYPREATLSQLFEAQVRRTPAAIAVECAGETLTYAELNARANAVGNALRERGVSPETVVGLAMERSVQLVASILGIFKAGGACMPLALDQPPEFQAELLSAAAARTVV